MTEFNIPNAPESELNRSTAAQTIAQLASKSGLLLSHFEHRFHWPIPSEWGPANRPDLTAGPEWFGGVLKEHKYRHFRYDNPVGSFHPGHRAKWTTHELCHALIGFAWRPDASPFFHSLSARLCEVLPVALWYFFDEIDLVRCDEHQKIGPLFGAHCPACEAAAERPTTGVVVRPELKEAGIRFVEQELAAVARSRRLGRPLSHRFATLDLTSDAIAWTAANRNRLAAPEFAWFRELFLGPRQGAFSDLDEMESRIFEVMNALTGRGVAQPLEGGRSLWIAQDLAWRFLLIAMECEGEVIDHLHGLIEQLAEKPTPETIEHSLNVYTALNDEWYLPEPADVYALGYPVAGHHGASLRQLSTGIQQSCPNTCALLGDSLPEIVEAFARADQPTRTPIARRFASFLEANAPGSTADVARYESSVGHPLPADPNHDALSPSSFDTTTALCTTPGVELINLNTDVSELIANLDDIDSVPKRPHTLAIRRTAGGEVVVAEISSKAADCIERLRHLEETATQIELSLLEVESLFELGLLSPSHWSETIIPHPSIDDEPV